MRRDADNPVFSLDAGDPDDVAMFRRWSGTWAEYRRTGKFPADDGRPDYLWIYLLFIQPRTMIVLV